jgi:hypothetical protein
VGVVFAKEDAIAQKGACGGAIGFVHGECRVHSRRRVKAATDSEKKSGSRDWAHP